MVPRAGIEPARYCYRGILSPLRLPISPPGQGVLIRIRVCLILRYKTIMEAEPGVEPRSTDLQSAA